MLFDKYMCKKIMLYICKSLIIVIVVQGLYFIKNFVEIERKRKF